MPRRIRRQRLILCSNDLVSTVTPFILPVNCDFQPDRYPPNSRGHRPDLNVIYGDLYDENNHLNPSDPLDSARQYLLRTLLHSIDRNTTGPLSRAIPSEAPDLEQSDATIDDDDEQADLPIAHIELIDTRERKEISSI